MNFELKSSIQKHLQRDEQVLWCGRPRQGFMFRAYDVFLFPFSLLWGGFAFFWEYLAITAGGPLFFSLFGLPFVLIGIQMIIGRFFTDRKIRSKTIFSITNQRAMIVYEGKPEKIWSWNLNDLKNISHSQKRNGRGDLIFGDKNPKNSTGFRMPWSTPGFQPEFDEIENPADIRRILAEAISNAAGGSFWEQTSEIESEVSDQGEEITSE